MKDLTYNAIPGVLFREFALNDKPARSGRFRFRSYAVRHVSADLALDHCLRPHTLVLVEERTERDVIIDAKLEVYRDAVPLEKFGPGADEWTPITPLLSVRLVIDHPPITPGTEEREWLGGHGYWVHEWVEMDLDDEQVAAAHPMHVEEEFLLLHRIQNVAKHLGEKVVAHGHWQVEWHPFFTYSRKLDFDD